MRSERFETVFEPVDPGEQQMIEALLKGAEIPFATRNEQVQNLFGAGQIGGPNLVTGGIQIQVLDEDAERAKGLLQDHLAGQASEHPELAPEPEEEVTEEMEAAELAKRYGKYSLLWSIFWLGGAGSIFAVYFGLKALTTAPGEEMLARSQALFGLALGVLGLLIYFTTWGADLGRWFASFLG